MPGDDSISSAGELYGTFRQSATEALGTFLVVFAASGAVVVEAGHGEVGFLGVALVAALSLTVAHFLARPVSGGLLNPALTIGFAAIGRIDPTRALFYVLAQIIGATAAAGAILVFLPESAGEAMGLGVPRVAPETSFADALFSEGLFSMLLAMVYLSGAREQRSVSAALVGVATMVAMVVAGPLTGAALNPARAFGPALVAGEWYGHALYWVGPIAGALVAVAIWSRLVRAREPE